MKSRIKNLEELKAEKKRLKSRLGIVEEELSGQFRKSRNRIEEIATPVKWLTLLGSLAMLWKGGGAIKNSITSGTDPNHQSNSSTAWTIFGEIAKYIIPLLVPIIHEKISSLNSDTTIPKQLMAEKVAVIQEKDVST